MKNDAARIARFNLAERLGHWMHALACLILLVTGLALVFEGYGQLLGAGGLRFFSQVHHVSGYIFTFAPLAVLILGTRRTFIAWIRACLTWRRDDLRFLLLFPREFFGLKAQLPPQGKFNAGEKVNSLLTMASFAVMVATGWIMLHPGSFGRETMLLAYTLHSAGAMAIGAVLVGHLYLAFLHPSSRESLKGMIWGTVCCEFAREHHARWYAEMTAASQAPAAAEPAATAAAEGGVGGSASS